MSGRHWLALTVATALAVGSGAFALAQDKKGKQTGPDQPPAKGKSKSGDGKQEAAPAPAGSATPPAADAAKKGHHLEGEWKVYWFGEDRTTQMNIVQVTQQNPGLTNFVGAIGTPSGEGCAVNGTVVDSLNGQFAEGIEVRTLAILSYVIAKANCAQEQLWLETFGLPSGKVLLSGRATFVATDGKRRYAPIALGR